ncbi:MAG TPA: alpha/beta fold hydrolase [Allosphingosinicella sp.]|nr:alpha/beta fold hydrolase [Allosphingosinicella sp.]
MRWLVALLMAGALTSAAGAATLVRGDLERRGELGFRTEAQGALLTVVRLDPRSPAARAGIRDGDRIETIDGRRFARARDGAAQLQRLRGGERIRLGLSRGRGVFETALVAPPAPLEQDPALDIEYGEVRASNGARLRTILTRPAGAAERLPVLFLTQWVSCGSLESPAPAVATVRALAARAGMALMRVDRSGTGDSLGPACHELDYDTEVRHYREALEQLLRHDWIDPGRVVIYGNSLGATTAPLVARGQPVAGILVQGGGAVTYIERMIGFDRNFLERSGVPPSRIDARMRDMIAFNAEYLLAGKAPEQIARERPDLAYVWESLRGTEEGAHYGRPHAWHQQAARHDFLAAWAAVEAPVLVFYGEFDQFETRHGHRLIVDTLNRLRPGSATFIEIAGGDHELEIYPTAEDAYAYRNGRAEPERFLAPAAAWLRRVTSAAAR